MVIFRDEGKFRGKVKDLADGMTDVILVIIKDLKQEVERKKKKHIGFLYLCFFVVVINDI